MNKNLIPYYVIGVVITSIALGELKTKREKEDKKMTDEAMKKVQDLGHNIFTFKKFGED